MKASTSFDKKLVLIREIITDRLDEADPLLNRQFQAILDELVSMERAENSDVFHPYYPKGIRDDFSFPEDIAELLFSLLDDYRNRDDK